MSKRIEPAATWPADVIHVNEDGWVLINRGAQHGLSVGLQLLVVGAGMRELRDLFPAGAAAAQQTAGSGSETAGEGESEDSQIVHLDDPVVLRTRRTYELLEVVHVEPGCAVAIAARTPSARRPQFYRGPDGDLLVWVPLPSTFTYPKPESDEDEDDEDDRQGEDEAEDEMDDGAVIDTPPQRADQEDERWEEALPLNGVGVGDQVVPAVPVSAAGPKASTSTPGAATGKSQAQPAGDEQPLTPFEQGRSYDWMKPQS